MHPYRIMYSRPAACLFCLLLLAGCTPARHLVQTDLYFGLSQPDGKMISDSAWQVFVEQQVSTVFTEGFTVVQAEGKWMDTGSKRLLGEPSRLVVALHSKGDVMDKKINSLLTCYKKQFRQQAVLWVNKKVKARF